MKKKLLSMLLVLAMILSMFPVGALAAEASSVDVITQTEAVPEDVFEMGTQNRHPSISRQNLIRGNKFFYVDEDDQKVWCYLDDPSIVYAESTGKPRNTYSFSRAAEIAEPGMEYAPYREPIDILMEEHKYSAECAAAILENQSDEAAVAYVSSQARLEAALNDPVIEIVVIVDDFTIDSSLKITRSITVLADTMRTISFDSTAEAVFMLTTGEADFDLKLIFSNVVLNCNFNAGGLKAYNNGNKYLEGIVIKDTSQNIWSPETSAASGKNMVGIAISGEGNCECYGCSTVGGYGGISSFAKGETIKIEGGKVINCANSILAIIGAAAKAEIGNTLVSGSVGISVLGSSSSGLPQGTVVIQNCDIIEGRSLDLSNLSEVTVQDVVIDSEAEDYYIADGITVSCCKTAKIDHAAVTNHSIFLTNVNDDNSYIDQEVSVLNSKVIGSPFLSYYGIIGESSHGESLEIKIKNTEITNTQWGIGDENYTVNDNNISQEVYNDDIRYCVEDCIISNNEIGICSNGVADVNSSTIVNNTKSGIKSSYGVISVTGGKIENNGSASLEGMGGIWFQQTPEEKENHPSSLIVTGTQLTNNYSMTCGGAINIQNGNTSVDIASDSKLIGNKAQNSGGAVYVEDYANLTVDETTEFRKNSASMAYSAPENAAELYPDIKFARTSLSDHPLNNYDISYVGDSRLNTITSVIPPEGLTVSWDNLSLEEIQSQLEEEKSQVKVTLDDGRKDDVSVVWDAINSELDGAKSGVYTLYGVLDITGKGYENPGEYPAPIKVTVKAPINSVKPVSKTVPHKTSLADLEALLLQEFPVVTAHLEDGTEKTLPMRSWNLEGLSEEYSCGVYNLKGNIDLSGEETISTPEYLAGLTLKVVPRIVRADQPKPIEVLLGTSKEDVLERLNREYPAVSVTLSEGGSVDLPVVWNISDSDYNAEVEAEYTVTGVLTLDKNLMLNPDKVPASVVIKIISPKPTDIIGVEEAKISVPSNVFLGTTDREHAIGGVASAIDLPEKVTVNLRNGETHNLPVDWQVGGFDPNTLGVQNFTGTVLIPDDSNISNPQGISAPLIVTVESTHFDVLSVSTNGLEIEVLPGTTLAEIQEKLEENGKPELHVNAYYVYYDYNEDQHEEEVFNFCDFSLSSSNNPDWEKEMDTPGEYELRVTLPENFTFFDESALDVPDAKIKVTVLQPLDIIEVRPAEMDAYQSVEPENFDDVPPQVMVVLSNGMEIPVDVDWDWTGSHYKKDLVLPQTVNGTLTNLPSKAKQPDGREPFQGQLDVNVIAVNYEVTEMQYEDYFNSNTLLSLEEITELEHPTANLTIASTTPGVELTTTYEAAIAFETEHNPDFDRKVADIYLVTGTLQVPFNITVPAGTLLEDIGLQTHPVTVKKKDDSEEEYDIDPIYIMVGEGTAFEDIKKPETAEVPFDIKGPDGKNKRELVEVDWGTGEGYNPNPDGVTDETPVEMTVYGTLSGDCRDYANVEEEPVPLVPLVIKVVRAYEITAITPSRIPETGELEVKLGSSLQDIYNLLDTHTVEFTLKSTTGTVRTESLAFQLKEDGNEHYDPETLGTYTLTPCLELPENITNPDNLKIQIVVKTRKYTISSTQGNRIGGIPAGTPFEDLPLPSTATVIRNDRQTEDIPVTWNEGNYDPNKIGSQVIRGTFNTPLPIHLENPNNRQPSIIVTTVNPDVTILSLKPVTEQPSKMRKVTSEDDTSVPGYQEYRYKAKILHKDGTVTEEIISLYEEIEAQE